MKKIIYLFLTFLMILTVLLSCDHSTTPPSQAEATTAGPSVTSEMTFGVTTDFTPIAPNQTTAPDSTTAPSTTQTTAPDSTTAPSTTQTTAPDGPAVTPPTNHTYTDFTSDEKELFNDVVGHLIPFLPNDEYYVEEYTFEGEVGVSFYTFGNTQAEFDAFRALFSDYTYDGTEDDEYGDAWYFYSMGDVYVDMTFYFYENEYVVDIYVYVEDENGGGSGDTPDNPPPPTSHVYTDFTANEKTLFESVVGHLIPFLPNDEYYVEEYTFEGEVGVSFYTFGNTQAEFDAFRALFSDYTYDGTEDDEYGDAWYFYSMGDVYVDMTFYFYENEYVVDVYVYMISENFDGDNDGGSGDGGDSFNVITNDGKGLPDSETGIYDVDFTRGIYVQNVTDQGYYIDGCPTTGAPAVLVIPVEFIDVTAESKGYTVENLARIFNGSGNDTTYYSVYDYFLISSYGQLKLDVTVLDHWFRPKNDSSYYENATYEYFGEMISIGDQLILDEALAYLATVMDLSKFDSDNNGVIDAVVLVNTLDIGDDDFHWAYRYWNVYTDDEGYYYEYDGVSANDYNWISYEFMFEEYDEYGEANYDPSNPLNPYTFIHEFAHILGADDYYDPEYQKSPMSGYDIMDSMLGDHNPYTKFHYGWLTTSRLIVTDSTVTVTLDAFSQNGDTIILANNWDEALGAYQEYYVIMYYTATELNTGEGGYFLRDGIIVYHVNASLYAEEIDGVTYYDVYYSNTSNSDKELIEFVLSDQGNYTYVEGDSLAAQTDDFGNSLMYTFTVDSLTKEAATVTFTKKT